MLFRSVVNASHLTALRKATKNILYATSQTNAMNGMGEGIEYGYAPPYWELALFGFDAAVAAGCILWGVLSIRKALGKERGDQGSKNR